MNSNGQPERLPNEDENRLWLGDYLDNRLSPAERSEAEIRLAGDESLRAELASMREIQGELKRLVSQRTSMKLPDSFADAVVDAAIDRAREEGLDDSHPLIQAGSAPTTLPLRRPVTLWRNAAVAAAVAASIMVGVFLATRGDDSSIAEVDNGPSAVVGTGPIDVDSAANEAAAPELQPESMLVEAPASSADPTEITIPDVTLGNPESPQPDPSSMASVDRTAEGSPAKAGTGEMPTEPAVAEGPAMIDVALLVFKIDVKDDSMRSSVINDTVRLLQQNPDDSPEGGEGLVRASEEVTNQDPNLPYQILYVSAPTKLVDRAYLSCVADSDRINGVGIAFLDGKYVERSRLTDVANRRTDLTIEKEGGDSARAIQDEAVGLYWMNVGGEDDPVRKAFDGAVFFQGGGALDGLTPSGLDTISHAVFLFQ